MAKVMQWLSIAANEIQNSLAAARKYFLLNVKIDLESAQKRVHEIFQIMNEHLAKQQWLERDRPTIADIAYFPYIRLAADGKISLEAYLNIITWSKRIKQLPG